MSRFLSYAIRSWTRGSSISFVETPSRSDIHIRSGSGKLHQEICDNAADLAQLCGVGSMVSIICGDDLTSVGADRILLTSCLDQARQIEETDHEDLRPLNVTNGRVFLLLLSYRRIVYYAEHEKTQCATFQTNIPHHLLT